MGGIGSIYLIQKLAEENMKRKIKKQEIQKQKELQQEYELQKKQNLQEESQKYDESTPMIKKIQNNNANNTNNQRVRKRVCPINLKHYLIRSKINTNCYITNNNHLQ